MTAQPLSQPGAGSTRFQSLQRLSHWLVNFLILDILACLFCLYSYIYVINWIQSFSGDIPSKAALELQSNIWVNLPPAIISLFFLVIVILFLIWIYRAYWNLLAFNTRGLKNSPGWALGYWFIPILNFFNPYYVMKEIYLASDPKLAADQSEEWKKEKLPKLFPWWWFTWILTMVGFNVKGDVGTAVMVGILWFAFASTLAEIVSALLLILIIKEINRRQEKKAKTLPLEHPAFSPALPDATKSNSSEQVPRKSTKLGWVAWTVIGIVVVVFSSLLGLGIYMNYKLSSLYESRIVNLKESYADFIAFQSDREILLNKRVIACSDSWGAEKILSESKKDITKLPKEYLTLRSCRWLEAGGTYIVLGTNQVDGFQLITISNDEADFTAILYDGSSTRPNQRSETQPSEGE